jgi:hypothetical protein
MVDPTAPACVVGGAPEKDRFGGHRDTDVVVSVRWGSGWLPGTGGDNVDSMLCTNSTRVAHALHALIGETQRTCGGSAPVAHRAWSPATWSGFTAFRPP